MTRGYRAVIFDAGGTLIGKDDPLWFEKDIAKALADLGLSASAEHIHDALLALQMHGKRRTNHTRDGSTTTNGHNEDQLWVYTFILENLGLSEGIQDKAAEIYDRFAAGAFIGLFSDVKPTLDGLKQRGITMGVLSNYPPFLERNFRLLGIREYFAFFVVSSMLGFEKPDPRIFQVAIREAGCPRENILYVGDSPHDDLEGARAAGLDVLLVDRFDHFPEVDCEKISNLTELLQMLE